MSTTPSIIKTKRNLPLAVLIAMALVAAAAIVAVAVLYSPPSKHGDSGEASGEVDKQSGIVSDLLLCDTKDPESVWSSAERRQCGRIDVRYNETEYSQYCDGAASTPHALCIGNELNRSYLLYGGFVGQDCGSPVVVGDFCSYNVCNLTELEVLCQDRRLEEEEVFDIRTEDAIPYNPVVKEIQGRVFATPTGEEVVLYASADTDEFRKETGLADVIKFKRYVTVRYNDYQGCDPYKTVNDMCESDVSREDYQRDHRHSGQSCATYYWLGLDDEDAAEFRSEVCLSGRELVFTNTNACRQTTYLHSCSGGSIRRGYTSYHAHVKVVHNANLLPVHAHYHKIVGLADAGTSLAAADCGGNSDRASRWFRPSFTTSAAPPATAWLSGDIRYNAYNCDVTGQDMVHRLWANVFTGYIYGTYQTGTDTYATGPQSSVECQDFFGMFICIKPSSTSTSAIQLVHNNWGTMCLGNTNVPRMCSCGSETIGNDC